jgi:hypothetical protein
MPQEIDRVKHLLQSLQELMLLFNKLPLVERLQFPAAGSYNLQSCASIICEPYTYASLSLHSSVHSKKVD